MGEYWLGKMVDYGGIEDVSSGKLIWVMTPDQTSPAEGHAMNRREIDQIDLQPGTYRLHYRTDWGHAYNNWDTSPPDNLFWGIALYSIEDETSVVTRTIIPTTKDELLAGLTPLTGKPIISIWEYVFLWACLGILFSGLIIMPVLLYRRKRVAEATIKIRRWTKVAGWEVCIDASSRLAAQRSAAAALRGGTARVEVCSDMSVDGLTPPSASIAEVRRVFGRRPGVLVMIRPRPGDFAYSLAEQALMKQDIEMAAAAGADGVVYGALSAADRRIELSVVRPLVQIAKDFGMRTVFHRAFDAVPDRREAVEMLVDCGVGSILTAGIPWGSAGSALDGLEILEQIVRSASGRIEVVIGGGIRSS